MTKEVRILVASLKKDEESLYDRVLEIFEESLGRDVVVVLDFVGVEFISYKFFSRVVLELTKRYGRKKYCLVSKMIRLENATEKIMSLYRDALEEGEEYFRVVMDLRRQVRFIRR